MSRFLPLSFHTCCVCMAVLEEGLKRHILSLALCIACCNCRAVSGWLGPGPTRVFLLAGNRVYVLAVLWGEVGMCQRDKAEGRQKGWLLC